MANVRRNGGAFLKPAVVLSLVALLIATGFLALWPATAAPGDTVADHVFGEPDFTHGLGTGCNRGTPNSPTAASLCVPFGVAVDGAGNVYVADQINNRVLEYDSPLATDTVADRVFGQGGSFTSLTCDLGGVGASSLCFIGGRKAPSPVAVDGHGNLYVADIVNSRVLEYDSPLTTDTVADRVFGQAAFATSTCNTTGFGSIPSASTLCFPVGVAVDSAGNLYVADLDNNRVLEYDSPLTTDTVADRVFGQGGDFTTNICNTAGGGSPPTAGTLCSPDAVGLDSADNLYVPDTGSNRVLEYDSPLTTNNVADRVFGQGSFTTSTCNTGGLGTPPTASSLCGPQGVAVDGTSGLYVSDTQNNRVIAYDGPLTTDAVADQVFGQGGSFTSNTCNLGGTSAASLCNPLTEAVDGAGNLYVADGNNRVLEYDTPLATDGVADRVFGQADFTSGGPGCNQGDGPTAGTLCNPAGATVDGAGNVYVADWANNRVLEYDSGLTTDAIADRVFGQGGDFTTGLCDKGGIGAGSLCFNGGKTGPVAVDGHGNLYVTDSVNSRVLEYDNPIATDTVADRVFGQANFTIGQCGGGASGLCYPLGVALDSAGNLYVADTSNNRVLEYDSPLTTNTVADRVFGQGGDFASNTCNLGGTSASSLCGPNAVAVDAHGNLYVTDGNQLYSAHSNNRVLEYDSPLTTNTVADRVFGQGGDFASNTCNLGGTSASSLCVPSGVGVDAAGNLYVADRLNNRVLEYDTPLATDTVADRVFGQGGDFATGQCNKGGIGAGSLCVLDGLTLDAAGNLYVADGDNNRVLEYDGASPTPTPAPTATHTPIATPTATPAPTVSPTPTPTAAGTSLTAPASVGATEIQVASATDFAAGDPIVINPGGANQEANQITGFGSLKLASALQFSHQAGEQVVKVASGDVNCSVGVDAVDALQVLRHAAGLSVGQQLGCPGIGTGGTVFGDVNCDRVVDAVDTLDILRYVAGLPVSLRQGCPVIG